MKFQLLATLSLSLVAASTIMSSQDAQAKDYRYSVNNRQQRQQTRIYKGIQSGSLTQREAANLQRRQSQLNRQEARYRASGNGLNPYERAKLQREQNQLSRGINNQANDRQNYH